MWVDVGRNIRRIIFYSIEKYSDGEVSVLSPVDAKQIAGRAGRYLSPYPHGEVTTYVCVFVCVVFVCVCCVCLCVCVCLSVCVCVCSCVYVRASVVFMCAVCVCVCVCIVSLCMFVCCTCVHVRCAHRHMISIRQ